MGHVAPLRVRIVHLSQEHLSFQTKRAIPAIDAVDGSSTRHMSAMDVGAVAAVSNRNLLRCIGREWHLADNRGTAIICPLLDQRRQNRILANGWLSAYDPKRTKGGYRIRARVGRFVRVAGANRSAN